MQFPPDRTTAERRGPPGWVLGLALVVAAAVHVPLAFTAWTSRLRYATPETPPIQLELDRFGPRTPLRLKARSAPRPTSTGRNPTSAPAPGKAVTAPATVGSAVPSVAQPKPPPPVGSPAEGSPGLTRVLRSSLGCNTPDLANLTSSEREACQRRLAAGYGRTGDSVFGIDPQRQAALEASRKNDSFYQQIQQGYLAAPPKKGCKPVTAQQARMSALGAKEGRSLSLGCAVPF